MLPGASADETGKRHDGGQGFITGKRGRCTVIYQAGLVAASFCTAQPGQGNGVECLGMVFPGIDREFEHPAFQLVCRRVHGQGLAEGDDDIATQVRVADLLKFFARA